MGYTSNYIGYLMLKAKSRKMSDIPGLQLSICGGGELNEWVYFFSFSLKLSDCASLALGHLLLTGTLIPFAEKDDLNVSGLCVPRTASVLSGSRWLPIIIHLL